MDDGNLGNNDLPCSEIMFASASWRPAQPMNNVFIPLMYLGTYDVSLAVVPGFQSRSLLPLSKERRHTLASRTGREVDSFNS